MKGGGGKAQKWRGKGDRLPEKEGDRNPEREREDTDAERGDRHAKKREQNPTRGKETQRKRDLKTDGDQTGVGVLGQT